MTPTWYDVLGVERDATTEQVRTAWKAGIGDLDPGDRRFRSLNEAAEVLLDPARRAAYDATLAPETEPGATAEPEPEPDLVAAGVVAGTSGLTGASESAGSVAAPVGVITDLKAEKTRARDEAREQRRREKEEAAAGSSPGRGVPAWVLAVLTVLALLMVASAAYLATQPSDEAIAASTSDAQGAAERSVVTILSYDYREMDQDQKAAGALMTADYRKKYDALFEQLKANAPDLQVVVTCSVVASGIVRSGEDRVQVLVFVNRPTTNKAVTTAQVYRDQVRMTMVRSGDDWLVDDMQTGPTAG